VPELLWLYLTAVLSYRTSARGVALADPLATVSHDRLTRRLQRDWSGRTRLELACRTRFVWEQGALIIDDTVLPQPYATALEGLAWAYSSQDRKAVYGLALGLRVWTKGTVRLPLGLRLWPRGGPSKDALALDLRGYARHRLRCHPDFGLFDAWYPSRALLKRVRDYGWDVVGRLKKNRRFNGQAVRHHRRHPDGAECGRLSGGLKALVVRYGKKYYATHRLALPAAEGRRLYGGRAQREEVLRVCTDRLGLAGGQARSEKAQQRHTACCLGAVGVLERARQAQHLSRYKLKRQLSCTGGSLALPALERIRGAA
jgi:hypothetical protein